MKKKTLIEMETETETFINIYILVSSFAYDI